MSVFVVIPTYNERENISRLIHSIAAFRIPGLKMLVVDDNSPDHTAKIVEELEKKYPVSVFTRKEKNGLGVAYRDAFTKITSGAFGPLPDYVLHMDADFSHDPKVIFSMLEEIKGADVVIGSRYVAGGSILDWSFSRRILSYFANLYARFILRLPYNDVTSGFRCYRTSVLEGLNFAQMSSVGYSFLVEMLYRAHKTGVRIKEVPIVFTERRKGDSKLTFGVLWESFITIIRLRIR